MNTLMGQRISAAARAVLDTTRPTPSTSSGVRREGAGRRLQRQDETLHQMSQRHLPQAEGFPKDVLIQLRVGCEQQCEGQEHQQHEHFEPLSRVLASRPRVLGVHRRRERSEGVVLDGPPQMGEFAHLERREGLIGRDDPEVLAAVPVGSLDPFELHAGNFEGMGHVCVPEAGNGLYLKGHAPWEIDSPGDFDRTGPAFDDLFRIAHDDEGLFAALDQKMGAEFLPAESDQVLGDVQPVPQDHIHGPLAVTLEETPQKRFGRGQLLASVLTRFKIGDGSVGSEDFEHARIAASQSRTIDGGGPKRTSFGQRDLAMPFLAKELTGLLKLFANPILIHPWKDSPEGGVRCDQVPRGAQPLSNFLLSSEEIHLMEALAMKRQTPDQEHEERRHGNVGVFAELRKAFGLLTEMELVVSELAEVCQTGRCPLLSIVRAQAKREKTPRPEPGRNSTPANYRRRGGFASACRRNVIQQSTESAFSLFRNDPAAPRPAPTH